MVGRAWSSRVGAAGSRCVVGEGGYVDQLRIRYLVRVECGHRRVPCCRPFCLWLGWLYDLGLACEGVCGERGVACVAFLRAAACFESLGLSGSVSCVSGVVSESGWFAS